MRCLPRWLRRQRTSLFIFLRGAPGGRTRAAELPARAGTSRRGLLAAGSRGSATAGPAQIPLPRPGHLRGSACGSVGTAPPRAQPHTAVSFLLCRNCDGSRGQTSARTPSSGEGEGRSWLLNCSLKKCRPRCPAEVMARAPRGCSNQNRAPSKPGAPCHLGWSTCAHVPKHDRMACAVEAAPRPHPLPALPPRCEAHAMAGR